MVIDIATPFPETLAVDLQIDLSYGERIIIPQKPRRAPRIIFEADPRSSTGRYQIFSSNPQ